MKLIHGELMDIADHERAKTSANFFKTGKGEYGEGDVFLGIRNGELRRISKVHWDRVGFSVIEDLLRSKVHDERLVALLILVEKFERGDERLKKEVFDFYLENARLVNNWDLVDVSAWKIVGRWLIDRDREVLVRLARSDSLWERRMGIVSTFAFIREGDVDDALKISEMLLGDDEDLMHKAVGWMLREVGKKNREMLEGFLRENYDELPRTTLRYAIERFEEDLRKKWLKGRC
ncbi:DNA alkylation repair protein [archaeon]|jgi:3-methyladenine DNA glycosylase AlkD|nr:DNA alkylation repair protein [archaeon]MBT7128793.1 DNA alkylation repair protein [archaeon]